MNTPDTEMEIVNKMKDYVPEKLIVPNGILYKMYEPDFEMILMKALSSSDTYWKERVEKQRIKQDAITDGAKEWKDGYNQALDTLLDNLK